MLQQFLLNFCISFLSFQCTNVDLSKTNFADSSTEHDLYFQASNKMQNDYESMPEWYLHNRVQVHTRLSIKDLNNPSFFGFPEKLSQHGAPVLVRQIKAGNEQPWWPSKVGTLNPQTAAFNSNGQNLAKKIITQLHDLGMKSIVYYRHTEDAEMYSKHPDWVCTDIKGTPIKKTRGYAMSLNSPYRDVLIERLRELASYGADGFLFDEVHIPFEGDFSSYSQKLYKEKYGTDMIKDYKSGNKLRFFEFRNNTMKSFFEDLRTALKKDGNNPMLIVSGNNWPTLSDLHMDSQFFNEFTLKSELQMPARLIRNGNFSMPDSIRKGIPLFYINAFCFSFMRDNSFGPPHIWSAGIHGTENANIITAGLISLGCIANVDIDPVQSNISDFDTAFSWDKQYGEYFEKLVPYSYAGVLASEKERNTLINTPMLAWRNVLRPAYNSFEKLYQYGIPVQIVSDAGLTKENISTLKKIYCNKELTQLPSSLSDQSDKFDNFASLTRMNQDEIINSLQPPVYCIKDEEYTHVNYFTDKQGYFYIVIASDFSKFTPEMPDLVKAKANFGTHQYTKNSAIKLFIKKENLSEKQIEDITNSKKLGSPKEEKGYYVFTLNQDNNYLKMYRFKSNL